MVPTLQQGVWPLGGAAPPSGLSEQEVSTGGLQCVSTDLLRPLLFLLLSLITVMVQEPRGSIITPNPFRTGLMLNLCVCVCVCVCVCNNGLRVLPSKMLVEEQLNLN